MPSRKFDARRIALLFAFVLVSSLLAREASAERVYVVREGDNLVTIARRQKVSVSALKRANRLQGDALRPGTRLTIPGPKETKKKERVAKEPETESRRASKRRAAELGLGSDRVAQRLLFEPPEPRWIEAAGEVETDLTFRLPVDDAVFFRGYGSGAGGYHLALDLGAPRGTPIHAAARGIVAFSGRALTGYGNLIILVHPNGTTTWYAHNHRNLVVAGQHVERGDVIGRVGTTGYADGPHVHFMLVHEGLHCDALPLLRPAITRAPETPLLEWSAGRPEELRCAAKTLETSRPKKRPRKKKRARRSAANERANATVP